MRPSRTTAVATALALVVAVGGVVAVVRSGGDAAGDSLTAARTTPRAVASSAAPTAATSPSASPRPSPRPPKAGRVATVAPPPATRDPERAPDDGTGYGAAPGVVTHPYSPSKRSYSATRDGIILTATLSTTRVPSGTPVTLTLKGSRAQPTCCSLHALYGDGGSDTAQDTACPRPADTSRTATFQHTWNKPGRWVLQLQASQSGCGGGDDYALMRVTVEVTKGTSVSNGPKPVVVEANQSTPPRPGDRTWASYFGAARDDDGHITGFVLDYGDGSPPRSFPGDPNPCREGPGGQPGPSDATLPYDPPHEHHYAEPGDYVVTLTATSAGCDGKSVQTGKATYTYSAS